MGPLLRTKLLSGTPLPNMGFSDRALRERAKLYRLAGVNMVSAQLESGPNQGRRKLWEEAGFSFYGGGALMHVLIRETTAPHRQISKTILSICVADAQKAPILRHTTCGCGARKR